MNIYHIEHKIKGHEGKEIVANSLCRFFNDLAQAMGINDDHKAMGAMLDHYLERSAIDSYGLHIVGKVYIMDAGHENLH